MKNCNNCGAKINKGDAFCPNCKYATTTSNSSNNFKVPFLLKLIFLGPWILASVMFILVGGIMFEKEYKLSKSYVETTGYLDRMYSCDDDLCSVDYLYTVDGVNYYVSPNAKSNYFPETDSVYYNPVNPSEAMMFSNWHTLFFGGVVFLVITLLIYYIIGSKIKKAINNSI